MRAESNIEKIVAAGAIQRLIELMRSIDVDVKRNSTGALANLASANDYKEQIVAAGVIPVVYDVLRSSDNEVVQQMAGRVIVNLAENGIEATVSSDLSLRFHLIAVYRE